MNTRWFLFSVHLSWWSYIKSILLLNEFQLTSFLPYLHLWGISQHLGPTQMIKKKEEKAEHILEVSSGKLLNVVTGHFLLWVFCQTLVHSHIEMCRSFFLLCSPVSSYKAYRHWRKRDWVVRALSIMGSSASCFISFLFAFFDLSQGTWETLVNTGSKRNPYKISILPLDSFPGEIHKKMSETQL